MICCRDNERKLKDDGRAVWTEHRNRPFEWQQMAEFGQFTNSSLIILLWVAKMAEFGQFTNSSLIILLWMAKSGRIRPVYQFEINKRAIGKLTEFGNCLPLRIIRELLVNWPNSVIFCHSNDRFLLTEWHTKTENGLLEIPFNKHKGS